MATTARASVIGSIAGTPERKSVNNKALAEFYIEDFGLRINAWEGLAQQVPDSGLVFIEGKLRTRTYQVDGKDRRTTELIASTVEVLHAAAADVPADLGF